MPTGLASKCLRCTIGAGKCNELAMELAATCGNAVRLHRRVGTRERKNSQEDADAAVFH